MSPALEHHRCRSPIEAARAMGRTARQRGRALAANPLKDELLRAAWAGGWQSADTEITDAKEKRNAH